MILHNKRPEPGESRWFDHRESGKKQTAAKTERIKMKKDPSEPFFFDDPFPLLRGHPGCPVLIHEEADCRKERRIVFRFHVLPIADLGEFVWMVIRGKITRVFQQIVSFLKIMIEYQPERVYRSDLIV
jgi:hypothetical protein